MQPDILCETSCKFFRCSEKFLRIVRKGNKKLLMCGMVDGDECIGFRCKYAICSYRPSALDISTGTCRLKKKELTKRPPRGRPQPRRDDDPLKYRNMLDKKLKKNFKIKDFY